MLVNEQYKVHILQVQASAVADEALSIRANRTLREVTAIYKKEEAGMDIVIRLPACYPLRVVEVECTRRLGISEALLRKWILSMAAFLRNQVCGFTGVCCTLLQNDDVSGYWGEVFAFSASVKLQVLALSCWNSTSRCSMLPVSLSPTESCVVLYLVTEWSTLRSSSDVETEC